MNRNKSDRQVTDLAITKVMAELQIRARRYEYRNDFIGWAADRLGITVWDNPENPERSQAEIGRRIITEKNIAVKAGHGVGKSFIVAAMVVWWVDTRAPDTLVMSTAPSFSQVSLIVWAEVRRLKSRLEQRYRDGLTEIEPVWGNITVHNEWKIGSDGIIVAVGRKPPDNKTDDAFQGTHRVNGILAIGDEATGLNEEMIDALGNITTTSNDRRVLICNPTNPMSYIGKLFRSKPINWSFLTISVFDSPNLTDPANTMGLSQEMRDALVDSTYVDSKRAEYGEGSPRWLSRVTGEFALDSDRALFGDEDLIGAYDTEIFATDDRPVLGVDVARFGNDLNVVYINHGGVVRFVDSWAKASTVESAGRIHKIAIDEGVREVRIDGLGVGGGVVDQVVVLCENAYIVREIKGSAASPDTRKWANWRAWSYDSVRHLCRTGDRSIDVTDTNLTEELGSIEYSFTKLGGIQLESKDDMRRRGMKSPDYADAFIYAAVSDELIAASSIPNGIVDYNDAEDFLDPEERLWDSL